jgi:hypothetical protein
VTKLRTSWLAFAIFTFFLVLAGASVLGQALRQPFASGVAAQTGVRLAIDADVGNGARPCDPIDAEATVAVGSTHKVGVCLVDYVAGSVNNFELHIRYTGALNTATELPDTAPALDDNPDANDGDDPAGLKLGGGWDCTALGVAPPVGDDISTAGVADAFMACNADVVNPDQDLTANPGLLATIEFTASAVGDDVVDFGPVDATNKNLIVAPRPDGGNARCGTSVPGDEVPCTGATIHKQGGQPAPTSTPTPSGGASPTATTIATAIATATATAPGPTATPGGPGPTPPPLAPGTEAVALVSGCNPLASTYADDTPIQTIADAVTPGGIVISLWEFQAGVWLGYSPASAAASNLREADFLDVVFACVEGPGFFIRPVV